jgi:hypothetical protein
MANLHISIPRIYSGFIHLEMKKGEGAGFSGDVSTVYEAEQP